MALLCIATSQAVSFHKSLIILHPLAPLAQREILPFIVNCFATLATNSFFKFLYQVQLLLNDQHQTHLLRKAHSQFFSKTKLNKGRHITV